MPIQPRLVRVLTPPPVAPSNLLTSNNNNNTSTAAALIAQKALGVHLSKCAPMVRQPQTSTSFQLKLMTVHSHNEPLVAYVVDGAGGGSSTTKQLMIVVQHLHTREIVWSHSLHELVVEEKEVDVLSKTAEAKVLKTIKEVGAVQALQFVDPATLYWSGGIPASSSTSTTSTTSAGDASSSRCNHLLIVMSSRIWLVNLRCSIMTTASKQRPSTLLATLSPEDLGDKPMPWTSNVIPISPTQWLFGTLDGKLRLYEWTTKRTLHYVTPSTKAGDCPVQVLLCNPYGTPDSSASTPRSCRVVCLTKKGLAFVMELLVNNAEGGGVTVTEIGKRPLATLEGGSPPPVISSRTDDDSSSGATSGSGGSSTSFMEPLYAHYDAFRDLFFWNHVSSKAKSRLLVWDLSTVDSTNKNQQDKLEPLLVTSFPYESTNCIFPGWLHESFPLESVTCGGLTKDGDFQLWVSPLYNSGSTVKNPFAAVPIVNVNLEHIAHRDLDLAEDVSGDLVKIKVHAISCPSLRDTSTFYVSTNVGILALKMADINLVPSPGTRHTHVNANFGSLGKAVLSMKGPEVVYSTLEPVGGPLAINPIGPMELKNGLVVYESPPPMHLPAEVVKRPVRMPPTFLMSPSKSFLCCFWKEEMRYEVLQVDILLSRVTSRGQTQGTSPLAASGTGVASFAWVGDDDVFAVLHNPEQDLALKVGVDLSTPTTSLASAAKDLRKLKEMASVKNAKSVAGKLKSLEGLRDVGKSTTKKTLGTMKGVGKLGIGAAKMTMKGTTKLTVNTAKLGASSTKRVMKGTSKGAKVAFGGAAKRATFGFMGRKSKKEDTSLATADDSDEEVMTARTQSNVGSISEHTALSLDGGLSQDRKFPWVELRKLVGANSNDGSSVAPTTNLGELALRSGNRNPPSILFTGPVLCVGSKVDEHDEGLAYFYTRKKSSTTTSEEADDAVSEYVSSGPAFPCPNVVVWDDDGRLCAVAIESQVSVYFSEEPDFVMLGTVRLGSSASPQEVISARFIHGVLFCTTRSSVHCVFLGDLEGGVCHLDAFVLASSTINGIPSPTIVDDYHSLTPPTIPLPMCYPTVLGFQNGGLIVSTVSGIQAVPMGFPLLRIGTLLGAGQYAKAERWFEAIPNCDHESLAHFLERRGCPELALPLMGISLERTIDLCMRYDHVDRLEEVVEQYGVNGLRTIDRGQGFASSLFGPDDTGASMVVCVGAFFLCHSRTELVRRMATECLSTDEKGKREAFWLASIMLSVDEGSDAQRVLQRSVEDLNEDDGSWPVGRFVRDHVLPPVAQQTNTHR